MLEKQKTPEGLNSNTLLSDEVDFSGYVRIPADNLAPERWRVAVAMFGHSQRCDYPGLMRDLIKLSSGRFRYGRSLGSSAPCSELSANISVIQPRRCTSKPTGSRPKPTQKPARRPVQSKSKPVPKLGQESRRTTFFPREEPVNGSCRFCLLLLEGLSLEDQVEHTHNCARKAKYAYGFRNFQCCWGSCHRFFSSVMYEDAIHGIVNHLKYHLWKSTELKCHWNSCSASFNDNLELHRHLKVVHGIYLRATPFPIIHCTSCLWQSECEFDWEDHCEKHIRELEDKNCAPTLNAVGRCPFCLGDERLAASQAVRAIRLLGCSTQALDNTPPQVKSQPTYAMPTSIVFVNVLIGGVDEPYLPGARNTVHV